MSSVLNYVGIFWRWPLDGTEHVTELVRAAFARVSLEEYTHPAPQLPYVQRVDLPLGAKVHIFGDLHGSFHSLLRTLWSLADTGVLDAPTLRLHGLNFALFLGDYVDRGAYGLETLAFLLAFKTANPGKVFMVRGNHEDVHMNDAPGSGGFTEELARKFEGSSLAAVQAAIAQVYETLPRAIYLGTVDSSPGWCHGPSGSEVWCYGEGIKVNFNGRPPPPRHLQCVHGGLEVGYDPTPLLRYYNAGASGDKHDGADEGSTVYFALIHGYSRGNWWDTLEAAYKAPPIIPTALLSSLDRGEIFRDWGVSVSALLANATKTEPHAALKRANQPVTALAMERKARRLANKHWKKSGSSPTMEPRWPLSPGDTNPACGFMWADFIVSGHRGIPGSDEFEGLVNARGRGLAWGEALTANVLTRYGLIGVLRAHQHNNAHESGPMLQRVLEGGGGYNNWGGEHNEWEAMVTTLLSGAFIPGLGMHKDAHAELFVSSWNPMEWSMTLCTYEPLREAGEEAWETVIEHLVPLARSNAAGAEEEDVDGALNPKRVAAEEEEAFLQWKLTGEGRQIPASICDWRRVFQCAHFPWKPFMPGGEGKEVGEWDVWTTGVPVSDSDEF